MCAGRDVVVVGLADVLHGLPVVVLRLGHDVGEDRDEDEWYEQSDDVAGEHGIVCACAGDGEVAVLHFCLHEPGGERAGET